MSLIATLKSCLRAATPCFVAPRGRPRPRRGSTGGETAARLLFLVNMFIKNIASRAQVGKRAADEEGKAWKRQANGPLVGAGCTRENRDPRWHRAGRRVAQQSPSCPRPRRRRLQQGWNEPGARRRV